MRNPLASQAARKTVPTLKRTSSLGTLFGQKICPLFLAGALLAAPGYAQAAEKRISFDTSVFQGGLTIVEGDTVIVEEGVSLTPEEGVAGFEILSDRVTVINNGTIDTFGDNTDNGPGTTLGYGDGIAMIRVGDSTVINNGLILMGDYLSNAIYFYGGTGNNTAINNGTIIIEEEAAEDNPAGDTYVDDAGNTVLFQTAGASAGVRMETHIKDDYDLEFGTSTTGHLVVNNGLIQSHVLQSRGMYMDAAYFYDLEDVNGDPVYAYDPVTGAQIFDGYGNPVQVRVDGWHSAKSAMYNYGTIQMLSGHTSNETYDVSGMRGEGHDIDLYNYGQILILPRGWGMELNGAGGSIFNHGSIILEHQNVDGDSRSYGIENYRNGDRTAQEAVYDHDGDPDTPDITVILEEDPDLPDNYDRSLTVNSGTIIVKNSSNAHGVGLTGHPEHDFFNYGRIESEYGYSIVVGDGRTASAGTRDPWNHIYLLDGSVLYGDVFVHQNTSDITTFHLGDGLNAAIRFDTDSGSLPDNIVSRNGYVIVGNTLYVVDLDGFAQQDQVAWSMVSQIQNAIDDGTEARPPAGDFAFNGDADGMANKWARVFGGWVQDDGDDDVTYLDPGADHTSGYSGYSVGTIVGVNKERLSYFAGAAYSSVSGDDEVSYDTYSGTLFGGVAGNIAERLNVSLTAGAAYNRTDRDMADNTVSGGIDSETANYASIFLSPSLLVRGPLGSSFRVNYLGTWTQGHDYSFSGGTQLDVDSRFSNVIGAQLQMAHNLPLVNDTFGTRIRYGVEASYADGQSVGYNLMGTDLETPYNNGFTARGFAALEVGPTYIEAGYNTDEQVSINAGLKLKF